MFLTSKCTFLVLKHFLLVLLVSWNFDYLFLTQYSVYTEYVCNITCFDFRESTKFRIFHLLHGLKRKLLYISHKFSFGSFKIFKFKKSDLPWWCLKPFGINFSNHNKELFPHVGEFFIMKRFIFHKKTSN